MKCPNCNGETYGKFCEYCGSELPSPTKAPDPASDPSRPQRTSRPAENTGHDRYDTDCPKCGSPDVYFDHRRFGRMSHYGTQHHVSYQKIGVCKKCGHTWRPGFRPQTSVSIWVWVLGWLLIFPVPVMILLNRSTKINPMIKTMLIVLAWVVYAAFLVSNYLPYFQIQ